MWSLSRPLNSSKIEPIKPTSDTITAEQQVRAAYKNSKSQLFYEEEKISRYRPGGYYPLRFEIDPDGDYEITQTFGPNNRYQIIQKLGYGSSSTVWLAKDTRSNKCVSIKVMVANQARGSTELGNAQLIRQRTQSRPGSQYLCKLLDSFVADSPNGQHRCLVTELLGPSISRVLQNNRNNKRCLDFKTILKLSQQLLQGVDTLHRAGCAHGDLGPRNVAFSAQRWSKMTADQVEDLVYGPYSKPLIRVDGHEVSQHVPRAMTASMDWDEWNNADREDLRILDFGETFDRSTVRHNPMQPPNLTVPEVFFIGHIDYRSDLWQAGILIFELICGGPAFMSLGSTDRYLAAVVDLLGPLPQKWEELRPEIKSIAASMKKNSPPQYQRPGTWLENYLEDRATADGRFRRFYPLIAGLTRFKPSDRISSSNALILLSGIPHS